MHLKNAIHASTYIRGYPMLTHCIVDAERDADMKSLSPEEAIAILSDMKIDFPIPKAAVTQRKRNVALDMAISALSCSEIPNSSDSISRQAAIDEMKARRDSAKEWYDNADEDSIRIRADSAMASFIECILTLQKLPSAQPERRWETCFDCPLSHGCPKIKGCTNEQAEQYASEIPKCCPLSTQPDVPDTNVGDMISRQAAIDALKDEMRTIGGHYCEEDRIIYENDAIEAIQILPAAQPTHSNTLDCISRQAAIDALDKRFDDIPMEQTTEILMLRKDLRALPSAQPDNQVNLCDSCKHTYPECPSAVTDVIFGTGKGNDNVCACNKYEPPAQPEIIRCKDCRYYKVDKRSPMLDGFFLCRRTHSGVDEDGFCYWAKGRTDD